MKKYKHFFKKNWFKLAILAILLITIFLRFYQYDNRFGLAYDQAHDALIAHYAVENFKLPLLGPFSSAGPFQTGGEWYWIIMIGTALYPNAVISPWIFLTSLYVVFVGIIMLVAYKISGKGFALIAGLLAAISTAQIAQGTNLTNQTPQALFALLAIWFGIEYIKKEKLKYLFLLGLSIGIASSIHLSGVALMLFAVTLLVLYKKINIKSIFIFSLAVIIPWIPVFLADMQNNFSNTKNMIYYYLHDQYNIPLEVLGRRWLTYMGEFWPKEFARIIGGIPAIGYLEMALLALLFIFRINIKKIILVIGISTALMFILLRYTHTPLFSSYLVFTHPFIILLTGWLIYSLIQKSKIFGFLLFTIIISFTLYEDYVFIQSIKNGNDIMARQAIKAIETKYKTEKFSVYTYKDDLKDKNYILALYLEKENRLDKNGIKISGYHAKNKPEFENLIIWGEKSEYQIVDLSTSSSAMLKKQGWKPVDAESVYIETEYWFK